VEKKRRKKQGKRKGRGKYHKTTNSGQINSRRGALKASREALRLQLSETVLSKAKEKASLVFRAQSENVDAF
jgi:hypothetical protein